MRRDRSHLFSGVAGVSFDLFGTLLEVDPRRLPPLVIDGEPRPSTVPILYQEIAAEFPDLKPERIVIEMLRPMNRPAEAGTDLRERSSRELFLSLLERLGIPEGETATALAVRLSDLQMRAMAAAARPLPGAARLLRELRARGLRTALVSNLEHAPAAPWLLEATRLAGLFDAIVLSEEVGFLKPDRAMFDAALRGLGTAAGETLHIGDDEIADVWGAGRLGMRTVWVRRKPSGQPPTCDPTLTVRRLAEVLPHFRP